MKTSIKKHITAKQLLIRIHSAFISLSTAMVYLPPLISSVTEKKQDKHLSNHNFPLHLPQKTKHHYNEPRYAALKWHYINFQWVFGIKLIGGGVTRMMFRFLRKMKRKMTVAEVFVLFFPITLEINGGS